MLTARPSGRHMTTPGRRRLVAAALGAVVVAAGLGIRFVLPRSAASDIGGDAMYALLAYAAVAFVLPRARPVTVAFVAGAFCVAVELFQLTGLPRTWAADFPPIALALGTGFDPRDIVVYLAAVSVAAFLDTLIGRRPGATSAPASPSSR